jgi:hypothetical protein
MDDDMPSGGARVRSGPPPDPNALRRERDVGEWTELPAEGRPGEAPEWPLDGQTDREMALWRRLWRMPQALMWQRYAQELEVALYVRQLVRCEKPRSPIILGTLVRQTADSLGLTTPGLRANRWRIAAAGANAQTTAAEGDQPRPSARDRLTVVRGGGAA